jgi:hypothetical protein
VRLPAGRATSTVQELHVQLQSVTGLRLLVALPALAVRLVLLIRREPTHAVPRQDAVHRGSRDGDPVEAMQVRRDPAGPQVIVLNPEPTADPGDVSFVGACRKTRNRHAVNRTCFALAIASPPEALSLKGRAECVT